jgi:hypothetical protein
VKTQPQVVGRWIFIFTALVAFTLLSAGCSSSPALGPTQPSAYSPEAPLPQKVLSTAGLISGTTAVSGQAIPKTVLGTQSPACPKLDSQLNQLVASADPAAMAASLKLRLKDGKVQVRLLLGQDDPSFLTAYEVELGSQAGQAIQAFVPLDRLCQIANLEQVLAILVPAEGIIP